MPEPTPSHGPRRIVILFAHPALHKSRVQRRLADAARDIEGVRFHDLYQEYPELDIDIEREQQILLTADLIVMQFPMYWYSTPAILKEWQDLVLERSRQQELTGHDRELEAAWDPTGVRNEFAQISPGAGAGDASEGDTGETKSADST